MQNKKFFKTIIFIVVLCIPLIYSFFYLKSYWDPYGDLSGMKIAVINLDTGIDGENQGNDFVSSLKESATFDIQEVSKEEAEQGMEKGTYFLYSVKYKKTNRKEVPICLISTQN